MREVPAPILSCLLCCAVAGAQTTERLSVSSVGAQVSGDSILPSICADGHLVAFESIASGLVPGDTNSKSDVFVRDRRTSITTRVSLDSGGVQADGDSILAAISADGSCVAFESWATNLVPGDTNGWPDIFVRQLSTGLTTRVSVNSSGAQSTLESHDAALDATGRFVAFDSLSNNLVAGDTNGKHDVFVRDLLTGATVRASVDSAGAQGNGNSFEPSLSGDGRYVAFASAATNLVPGDTNNAWDVFVHDLQTGQTVRASVDSAGMQSGPFLNSVSAALSSDGRWVAFHSDATNLVAGDTNGKSDVFVHDLQTGATSRESVGSLGVQANDDSFTPALSANGRFVSFHSRASNLVPGVGNTYAQVIVRDRWSDQATCASVDAAAAPGNGGSFDPALSADGRVIAFFSAAFSLVPGDTNLSRDVFARDCQCSQAFTYCTAKQNSLGCTPAIFATGVPSASSASGFTVAASNELNGKPGVLLYGGSGRDASPFHGGTLCVALAQRTPISSAGGNPVPAHDCSGVFSIDMNAFASGALGGGPAPFLRAVGWTVESQWWGRDRALPAPAASSLTAGIEYVVGP